MLTLLRDLRRLRHDLDLLAPARGRSLAVRHVDAGSCNGCEHELTLAASPYYDLQRHGFGSSPPRATPTCSSSPARSRLACAGRSSPPTRRCPSRAAWQRSATARSAAGILGLDSELAGPLEEILPVDVRIPGCPPTPDTIATALAELCDRKPR